MSRFFSRRHFAQQLGLGAASLPFLLNLQSLVQASPTAPRQRLVIVFSPNGVIPPQFWPDEEGNEFSL